MDSPLPEPCPDEPFTRVAPDAVWALLPKLALPNNYYAQVVLLLKALGGKTELSVHATLDQLFPQRQPAAASKALERLIHAVNDLAHVSGVDLKLQVVGAKKLGNRSRLLGFSTKGRSTVWRLTLECGHLSLQVLGGMHEPPVLIGDETNCSVCPTGTADSSKHRSQLLRRQVVNIESVHQALVSGSVLSSVVQPALAERMSHAR